MRAHPCARLFAKDTLTTASVLPGVGANYPVLRTAMECGAKQLRIDYVRSSRLLGYAGL